jgi:hypothetical protein
VAHVFVVRLVAVVVAIASIVVAEVGCKDASAAVVGRSESGRMTVAVEIAVVSPCVAEDQTKSSKSLV